MGISNSQWYRRNNTDHFDGAKSYERELYKIKEGSLDPDRLESKNMNFATSNWGESEFRGEKINHTYIEAREMDIHSVEVQPAFLDCKLNEEYIIKHDEPLNALEMKDENIPLNNESNTASNDEINVRDDNGNRKVPIDYIVTELFLAERDVRCCNGSAFLYNNDFGNFKEQNEANLQIAIRACLTPEMDIRLNKQRIADVVHRIISNPRLQVNHDDFDQHTNLINFKDCVYNIETGCTHPHKPEYMFTSYIDADYGMESSLRVYYKGKQTGNIFFDFLEDCTEGDLLKIKSLQQLTGYIISNEWRAKKFFVLLGPPHTGKSIWLELWRSLIGPKHTTAMSLNQLGESRFMTAELFRSKINISAEMDENGSIKGTDIIKTITGGDLLTAEKKGRDPFQFHGKTKLIAAGNYMPRLAKLDGTSAFTDRMLFLIFNNSIPEERRDKSLMAKILSDKTLLVRWAIEGLLELKENELVFTESKEASQFKQQYINELNNVPGFLNERCIVEKNNHDLKVQRKHLYPAYLDYCKDNERALTKEEFFAEVKKTGVIQAKVRVQGSDPLWGFKGIKLNSTYQEDMPEEIES